MIRIESSTDVRAIRNVNATAFPTPMEADLVDRLCANGRLLISLVAEIENLIAGHVAFSPVTIDGTPDSVRGAGLAPVAVLPSQQQQGLGAALIRRGLDECRNAGFAYVVVLGEPHYYRRFGFETAAPKGLGNEYGAHDEFMVLELQPGALDGCSGLVKFCAEFAELG